MKVAGSDREFTTPVALMIMVSATAIIGLIVMGLWNTVVTKVFGLPSLTWIDATFLWVLVRIMVAGSFKPPEEDKSKEVGKGINKRE
jgi:TRAP-type mannitol/chloroaromatic compound transport system permease small subunit